MTERSEGKEKYEFTDNLSDITNSLEEMVKQDGLITRSSSNLKKYGSEQLDVQEKTPVVIEFFNNSWNICGMDKFINEKNCETYDKPAKYSINSQRTFLIIC